MIPPELNRVAHRPSILLVWAGAVLVLALAISVPADALSAPSSPKKVLRVCQSPGCKDDGALETFDCLSAMAPPGVDVIKGGCVSLCGSGPVVEFCNDVEDVTSTKKKRVKGRDTILSLLDECTPTAEEGGEDIEPAFKPFMRDRLMNGYELALEAKEAYDAKNYQLAVDLYTDAIENGRKSAMMLQEDRNASGAPSSDDGGSDSYPKGMQWLVASFKNSCRSRLYLDDVDGARRDAFAATVFFSKFRRRRARMLVRSLCHFRRRIGGNAGLEVGNTTI